MEVDSGSKGVIHRNRSKNFVESLADKLLHANSGSGNVASLSKHNEDNRFRFGMNELLFDVAVFQYGTVDSGASGRELFFVKKGLWIVESELARNKREALYDFNKLILGRAENKLFIGPRVDDEKDYLRVLGEAARYCDGRLFVALIPHPDEWPVKEPENVRTWSWRSGEWKLVA